MHKSLRSALPALRPVSPASVDNNRDSFSKANAGGNSRFSSDFEVNRSLFVQDPKLKILPPTKPKIGPRSTQIQFLEKKSSEKSISSASANPPQVSLASKPTRVPALSSFDETSQKKSKPTTPQSSSSYNTPTPETTKEKIHPYLQQIQDLFERIPTGKEPIPLDEVYRLSPVLDRVLCIISEWKPDFINENIDHPIVLELQQRLFNLIDIDDFLIRTIICRILLSFATDASSPLLLPISRIFYKLSCDQTNDMFFEDEHLVPVLMSLVKITQPEARVFAAGAIRNIASCEGIRKSLLESDFLQLAISSFEEQGNQGEIELAVDQPLRAQMLGAVKQMCKNDEFKKKLADSHLLIKAAKFVKSTITSLSKSSNTKSGDGNSLNEAVSMFIDIIKIVSILPELSKEEKIEFIKILNVSDLNEPQLRKVVTRSLVVLSADTDDTPECTLLVIKLLLLTKDEPDFLYFLLAVAQRCAEAESNVKLLQKESDFFIKIVKSQEYDINVCLSAYMIVKCFKGEQFQSVIDEYAMLTEIKQSK